MPQTSINKIVFISVLYAICAACGAESNPPADAPQETVVPSNPDDSSNSSGDNSNTTPDNGGDTTPDNSGNDSGNNSGDNNNNNDNNNNGEDHGPPLRLGPQKVVNEHE